MEINVEAILMVTWWEFTGIFSAAWTRVYLNVLVNIPVSFNTWSRVVYWELDTMELVFLSQ